MEVWNTLRSQIAALWAQWSLQQRIGMSAAAVACLAAVLGTLYWATLPQYELLASGLTLQKSSEIQALLEPEQIEYQLGMSGKTISVPRGDLAQARVTVRDVLEPSHMVDAGGASSMFPAGAEAEHEQRRLQLEMRIARTLEQMHDVRSATVMISLPDETPFVMEQVPPEASVTIQPAGGRKLSNRTAHTIIQSVAGAVPRLLPNQVKLSDTHGNLYTGSDGVGNDLSGQLEYLQTLEMYLEHKARMQLSRILGEGRAMITVNADVDFREISRTEKTVDPELTAKLSEDSESFNSEGAGSSAGGTAGLDANRIGQGGSANGTGGGGSSVTRESTNVVFENAGSEEKVLQRPGSIRRLTVAVTADLSPRSAPASADTEGTEEEAAAEAVAPSITQEQIEALVQNAVGFDRERGDQISVTITALPTPVATEPTLPSLMPMYEQYKPLIEAALVGLGATMAFLMAVLALRRLKPVVVQESGTAGFTREDYEQMAELSQKARHNPEVAARILSTWLGQEETDGDSTEREVPRRSRAA